MSMTPAAIPAEKICLACKRSLSLDLFGPKKFCKFGRRPQCKECMRNLAAQKKIQFPPISKLKVDRKSICRGCGIQFDVKPRGKIPSFCTKTCRFKNDSEFVEKLSARSARYRESEKGKAAKAAYQSSEARKIAAREAQARYRATEGKREIILARQAAYRSREDVREKAAAYRRRDDVKKKSCEKAKRYAATEAGKNKIKVRKSSDESRKKSRQYETQRRADKEYRERYLKKCREVAIFQSRNLENQYVAKALGLSLTKSTPELLALKREQLAFRRMARELKKAIHESITSNPGLPGRSAAGGNERRPASDRGEQPARAGSKGDQRDGRRSDGQGPRRDQQQPQCGGQGGQDEH